MGIEENKEVARKITEKWGEGDVSVFDELATGNFVIHVLSGEGYDVNKDVIRRATETGHIGFPDYSLEIIDMIAEGDKVLVIGKRTGTNTGEFLGIPPTGKKVTMFRMLLYRCENGKVAEAWGLDDYLGQYQQLGVLPPNAEFIQAYKDSLK